MNDSYTILYWGREATDLDDVHIYGCGLSCPEAAACLMEEKIKKGLWCKALVVKDIAYMDYTDDKIRHKPLRR